MATINEKLLIEFSDKYLGYGNIEAPLWFIWIGLGSIDDVELLDIIQGLQRS